MGDDQTPNRMNLDLNLGPFRPTTPPPPPPAATENDPTSDLLSVNLEDWIDHTNRLRREAGRIRVRNHWRSIEGQIPMPIPLETRRSTGEGSGPAQPIKTCDNNNSNNNPIIVDDNGDNRSGRKEDDEKADQGSFFDCNICLDLSMNPVVTCCGHLFCWTCIYQWLHLHSDAKECPVCKGEVTLKTVTPIYGRGIVSHELVEDPTLKIPARPQAHRVESWRQTIERNAFTFPVEEMIRRLGNRYDLTRDLVQVQMHERNNNNEHAPLLDRILTSRALRREHNNLQPDEVVDLTESSATNSNSETVDERRLVHLMLRRQQAPLAANTSQIPLINSAAERVRRRIFRVTHNSYVTSSAERNQEHHHHPLSGEDRDSVSSIAAVIQSGSQMVDNAMEIDSNVSNSTSTSSRRRQDASRVSDMDSGDSRPPTRRRRTN